MGIEGALAAVSDSKPLTGSNVITKKPKKALRF
jgi:hypothetical protein